MTSKLQQLRKIPSTGHVQWDVYTIVREAFCPYRSIKINTPAISHVELIKNMQFDMYVKLVGEQHTGEKIVIAILGRNEKNSNDIATTTEKFRLFINGIREQDCRIILISPCRFATHVMNYIVESGLNKRVSRYSYDNFKVVVPLGPGCSEHRLATAEEARAYIELHKLDPKEMKRIYTYDPQMVWLGGVAGDYVIIDRFNPLSGRTLDLRRVVRGEPPA